MTFILIWVYFLGSDQCEHTIKVAAFGRQDKIHLQRPSGV